MSREAILSQQPALPGLEKPIPKSGTRGRGRHPLTLEGRKIVFDSKEERTLAQLLHYLGILTKPSEGDNIHPLISHYSNHSVDFYLAEFGVLLEYHPLHWAEAARGLTLEDVTSLKLAQLHWKHQGLLELAYLTTLKPNDVLDLLQYLYQVALEKNLPITANFNFFHPDTNPTTAIEYLKLLLDKFSK